MNSVYKAALEYVRNGISVIPIKPGTKEPAVAGWKEYQHRRPTSEELKAWFADGRNNIAVVTGPISGLAVIDVDGPDGDSCLSSLGVGTSFVSLSGKGRHLYFRYPENGLKNSVRKLPGIDTRGEGGYVIAPPSVHPNGKPYRWLTSSAFRPSLLPEFPTALFETAVKRETEAQQKEVQNGANWVSEALATLSEGNRNITFTRIIGRLHRDGWEKDAIEKLLSPHVRECGLPMSEFWASLRSITSKPRTDESNILQKAALTFSIGEAIDEHLKRAEERRANPVPELPTGFREIDSLIWGLRRGNITTVGARYGVGKTSFALTVAARLTGLGKRVLFFSTEMQLNEVLDRLAAVAMGVQLSPGANGNEAAITTERLHQVGSELRKLDFHISDSFEPALGIIEEAVARVQPDCFFFDHFQHAGEGDDSSQRYVALSKFIRGLHDIARETNTAALVTSQLNRLAETETPSPRHLKECGTLEDESGAIILLHRLVNDPNAKRVPVVVNIAKNRFGPRGQMQLMFNADLTRFEEVTNNG